MDQRFLRIRARGSQKSGERLPRREATQEAKQQRFLRITKEIDYYKLQKKKNQGMLLAKMCPT
jgi:hypothetical protein